MIQKGNVDAIDAIAASCQAPRWPDVCQTKLCVLEQTHKAFPDCNSHYIKKGRGKFQPYMR